MKILLLGKDGQVGWELQRALAPLGELVSLGRAEADLEDHAKLAQTLAAQAPSVIVNAAAYTAVDKAESEPDKAARINAGAPAVLAEYARQHKAWLVHYSTDYVFDGSKSGPYVEHDATNPISVYGKTKRDGEAAIEQSGCRHLTFRTSWVFAARGGNFAKTMLRLAKERDSLNVVADQFGAPTSAELIADTTALCLHAALQAGKSGNELSGIYHLVAAGECTWHEYARFVIDRAAQLGVPLKASAEQVKPIPASQYPTPAKRPANSRMATTRLEQTFGLKMPPWQHHVTRLLDEICAS
jgi:dTDP-4-dehydrorhamnose reductase